MRIQDSSNSLRKNWGAPLVALAVLTASCSSEAEAQTPTISVADSAPVRVSPDCIAPLTEYLDAVEIVFTQYEESAESRRAFYQLDIDAAKNDSSYVTEPGHTGEAAVNYVEYLLESSLWGVQNQRQLGLLEAAETVPEDCFADLAPDPWNVKDHQIVRTENQSVFTYANSDAQRIVITVPGI